MNKDEILRLAQEHRLRRVLVVTALSLEMKAVRAHLTHLGSVPGRSGTVYECGRFAALGNEWLVVVAESGAGTHSAQGTVTAAHMEFEKFEVVIFVGIAASRKEEAPIGSVVASSYLYLPYSGKYDAELGFTSRPHSLRVDPHLIGYAQKVEREAQWPTRIRPPLNAKLPADAEYPQPFPPAAFIAPIASIEAVSADPKSDLEAIITKHYGDAFAIEMEGYGAAYAAYSEGTPLIVVRGISDMRGGKTARNDLIHQPVAAAHAAAFAFELLDLWGQYKPLQAPQMPLMGKSTAPAPEPAPQPAPPPTPEAARQVQDSRQRIVLNFSGDASEFPPEKIEQVLQALRTISNDPSLTLIRTEEGSFRMIIEAREGVDEKLGSPDVQAKLLNELSADLAGVLSEGEYRQARNVEESLKSASRDLLEWPQKLPDGTHLQRPEFEQILSIIDVNESSTTALLGGPGSGKSALLAAIGQELVTRKVPFLAIKADLLDPSIQNEDDLASSLAISESVSALMAQISLLKPVVLLIDQLDALAGYVDLRTGRLSVLLNLVRKLGGRKNVHIVLSARTFEYEHDTRLKAVRAESLMLALPPWSAVLKVLESHGVQAAGWPADAQELMRTPQTLATFLKLKNPADTLPFRKYQAMLDMLWKERILAQPNGSRIAKLASTIAETMAETESLWLAAARFEDHATDLSVLVANGIITDFDGTGGRIGFSHQTVFEYALARLFARGEFRLSSYILERQASLFVRPKLWATLTYLREVDPATYQAELNAMWSRPDLRSHLRHMLIEFLGQQGSPTNVEATFFNEALASENRRVALQAAIGSPGWFKLLNLTHISTAMTSEKEAGVASAILDKAWTFAPEVVTALIKKHWLPDIAFDGYTWQTLQENPRWDEHATALALTVLGRTNIAPFAFEHTVSMVGVEQPETALKLVSARLTRHLAEAVKESEKRAADAPPEGSEGRMLWYMTHSPSQPLTEVLEKFDGWDSLDSIAKSNGELFIEYIWPHFTSTLDALRRVKESRGYFGFSIPHLLDFRFEGEHSLGLTEPPLLAALASAIVDFAASNPDNFLKWLATNEHEDATPAQRLFAHALASQPERYADRAEKFLVDNKERFHLGCIEDYSSTSKRLIKAVSPFWSDPLLSDFAQEVMAYDPVIPTDVQPKSRQHLKEAVRRTKLGLLDSLPANRLPQTIRRYLDEEHRRFPESKIGATFHGPTWIGSPMSAQNMAAASDDDIFNAFKKLPDASDWDHPTRIMEGGNIQLSREFAEFAKTNPERAISLIRRFEPSIGTRASGYALDAMAEDGDPDIVLGLIEELTKRGFSGSEFRDSVARGVERLVRRDVHVTDTILALLESWLVEPTPTADPENGAKFEEADSDDEAKNEKKDEKHDSILWGHGSISSLPHGNYPPLETITRVLLARREADRLVALYQKHLKLREDQRVWQALLQFFRYIHPSDLPSFGQFILELFGRYPDLARKREAAVMLAFVQWRLPDTVRQVISNWNKAEAKELRQAYGELVGLMALSEQRYEWAQSMLTEILADTDPTPARVGTAHAAVNLWSESKAREGASRVLQAIIPNASAEEWSAIFDLFRVVDEITPEQDWVLLLQVLADHIANAKHLDSSFVVDRLQTLLPHQATLVARVAKGLVMNWRNELGDLRTGTALVARDLVDLAITLHRLGPETREAGTSLFEDLLYVSAYAARETLAEIDNRFMTAATPPRRRLPRRQRRLRTAEPERNRVKKRG